MLAENGVSVDLVAGRASIAGAVPTGKMFVDGLITGDVGDATLGERLILSSGFIARDGGRAARYRKARSACASALARLLRRPEGAGAGGTQGRGGAGSPCRRQRHRRCTRIAQAVRRTVGKWVGETYRRQPMIVPTVIEI